MDNFEGTYAPQSPDLSGYHSYDQPTTFNEPYSPPSQQPNHYPNFHQDPSQNSHTYNQQEPFDPFAPDHSTSQFTYQQHQQPVAPMPKSRKSKTQRGDEDFNPDHPQPKQGRQSKKQKQEEETCNIPAPGTAEGVDVKTKFPVARIKRIMQADEDVGKVSQVTPTAVSKALELFIISLTLKSSAVARSKSSKRVTAAHLKQAVVGDVQMDFLEQIVSKIPDGPTASKPDSKRKGAATEEEDDSSDDAYVESRPKKKAVAVRKKRAKGSDD